VKAKTRKTSSGKSTKAARPASRTAKKKARQTAGSRKSVKTRKTTRSTGARVSRTSTRGSRKPAAARPVKLSVTAVEAAASKTRNERKLTRNEVEQFRRMLLQKRAEILGDVSTLHDEALNKDRTEAAGDVSAMPIHMADLGTDNYELEFTLGLIEGERAILKEIDEALARIQDDKYGVCLATGKPIGKARLKAKPWAKYCYEYTLAQEKGQVDRL
jgi:DnaK suppressor protein